MKPAAPPAAAVVEAATAKRALSALRSAVGAAWVFDSNSPELDNYRDAYTIVAPATQRPWAAVAPANLKQLQKVLDITRRHKLTLWPLSTGRNLGYGGAAPRQAGALVLDLKRMKRVLEVNETLAYAVVEPGVTYLALHRHLRNRGSRLWLDPTASGWGGPLGNFLERGVGYTPYGQHADTQCGLEVVLADGTLVTTANSPQAKTDHLYRYGHRAWVDGLFNQSNFGIVTRIGIHLMPAPADYRPYLITIADEDQLGAVLDALQPLSVEGVLAARATLMSLPRAASYSTTRARYQDGAGPLREDARRQLMNDLNLGSWNLYGALYGAPTVMDNHWRVIETALRDVPGVRFHFAASRTGDAAFKCRADLMGGVPNMDEYKTLDWLGAGAHLDCVAVLPFDGDAALSASRAARDLCHARGFDYCAEFQLEARALRHEVRLLFERDVSAQQHAAHDLGAALSAQWLAAGHGNPRAHLAFMDASAAAYSRNTHALLHAGEALKDVLDQDGILAPGKSGLWPGRYLHRKKS